MRILHVIPAVAPRYGGPSGAIAPMCRALAGLGVESAIATTDADGEARLAVPTGTFTSWEGVPTVFFRKDFSESFKYAPTLGAWLDAHVREYDLVHVHAVLSYAPIAAAGACRRAGVPYIVRPLGTLATWSLRQKPVRKRLLLRLAGRRLLAGASAVHYTSDEERRDVEERLQLSNGAVVPLGIDPDLLAQPVPVRTSDLYILVLSRLHPKKNLGALIESFSHVVKRPGYDCWRLVIAGQGDERYERALRARVEACGVGSRVAFLGWVEGALKRELLAKASLFAMPSLQENFGVSLVEALACAVPVIVARDLDLAGLVEREHAGWVVAGDGPSLEAGLAAALGDPGERDRRGWAARSLARPFAWPAVAGRLLELYKRVLLDRPGAPVRAAAPVLPDPLLAAADSRRPDA